MTNDLVQSIALLRARQSEINCALETRDAAHGDTLDCMEVRFDSADDGTLEGLAVRFGVVDNYRTSFDRDAFPWEGRSLPLLWSHDRSQVLGSVRSITPDGEGLRIKARLNLDIARAREVRSMLANGDINGLSIGFQPLKHEVRAGGVKHFTRVQLREVSVVAIPAVPGSRVTSVRSSGPDLSAFLSVTRAAAQTLKG